jgi:murein DD-endopeptidase MepM/ murein hydrolase activator NlpD
VVLSIVLILSAVVDSLFYSKYNYNIASKIKEQETIKNDLTSTYSGLIATDKKISGFVNYIPDETSGITLLKNLKLVANKVGYSNIVKIEPLSASLTNDGKITQIPVNISFVTTEKSLVDFFRYFTKTYPEPTFDNLQLSYKKGILTATVSMLSTSVSIKPSLNEQPDQILEQLSNIKTNNNIFGFIYDYDKQLDNSSDNQTVGKKTYHIVIGNSTGGGSDSTVNNEMKGANKLSNQKIGIWYWPLNGYYNVSSGFGPRTNPITNQQEIHQGIDIPCPTGTNIYACTDGVISFVGDDDVYGNYIILSEYNTDVKFLYGHLSKILVKEGDSVKAKQIIGNSGTTGLSTGPHLHFGISMDGQYVDPMTLTR